MYRIGLAVVALVVAIGSLLGLHPGLAPQMAVVSEPAPTAVMSAVVPRDPVPEAVQPVVAAPPAEPAASRLKKAGPGQGPARTDAGRGDRRCAGRSGPARACAVGP